MSANTTLSHTSARSSADRARPAAFAAIDVISGAVSAVARWWTIRQDEHFLQSQPDHLLRDVGIERSEIPAVLRGVIQR